MVIWQQNFVHFGADDVPLQFLSKSVSESSFSRFGVEIHPVLQQLFLSPPRKTIVFINSVAADCVQVPCSCGCVRTTIVFYAERRRLYWGGCIKAAMI